MSEAAKEAAAALAPDMLAELVEKMPLTPSDRAAVGGDPLAESLAAAQGDRVEAQPEAASQPQATAVAEPVVVEDGTEYQFVVPTFEPDLDEEYRELLEAPDFEEEAAAEVNARLDNDENEDYTDPETAKEMLKLQKRNEWLEQQVIRASKPKWVAEARKMFPDLAKYAPGEIEKIAATSRRGFAREAANLNTRFAAVAKPLIDELTAQKNVVFAQARDEGKAESQASWGTPTVGPPVTAVQLASGDAELNSARKSKQLHKVINIMFKQSGLGGGEQ